MSDSADSLGLDIGDAGAYQVLARKYRPQTFVDLIGQEAMVRTLTNAFASGRIAHAFMLTGVRGVGKTTTARLLARALNYEPADSKGKKKGEDGPSVNLDPPGVHCAAIAASRHTDVMEMDAASRTGVGDIREILEGVRYAAQSARYKVYIIDEVHMLSTAAFNALLKTLEEPPSHVKFIFATTEIRKVPVTVLSRCQRFDLKRVAPDVLLDHLKGICTKEKAKVDSDGLKLIVRAAEGSVRDALSLLDQAIVQSADGKGAASAEMVRDMLGLADRARTFDLFAKAIEGDGAGALAELDDQHAAGADPIVVIRDVIDHCHDVTRAKVLGEAADFADAADHVARVRALGEKTAMGHLSRAWQMLLKAYEETRAAPDPLAAAEMALLRLAHAASLPSPEEAAKALAGQPVSGGQGGAAPQSDASSSGAPADARGASAAPAAPDRQSEDEPTARLRAVSGGRDRIEPASAPAPEDAPELDPADDPTMEPVYYGDEMSSGPRTWMEIIELVGANRDLILKTDLERAARPVRVEPGRVVFQPTDKAPPDLAASLSRALSTWTDQTWFVNADENAKGGETVAEARARERAEAHAAAMADPLVARAMKIWPGAMIAEIRPVAPLEGEPPQEEPDQSGDSKDED
ncbi:MAG: DNA polymerase III subunit gamma/tau [Maricaulaceae bacterium]|jgi:DNA polymerase-3 subunit gamma/tau